MKNQRPDARRSRRDNDEEYPEVFLEPIENPGFDEVFGDEEEEDQRRSSRGEEKKRKRTLVALLCCVIALAMVVIAYVFITNQKEQAAKLAQQQAAEEALRIQREQDKADFEAYANAKTFAEGITVDGIAIGGMSMDEARAALQPAVQAIHTAGSLQLAYGEKLYTLNLSNIIASNDLEAVLTEAYKVGKTGDLAGMRAELEDVKANGRSYTLTANYDLTALQTSVANVAEEVDTPAANAKVSAVNTEERIIEFSDAVTGVAVQQDVLVQRITDAILSSALTPVEIPVTQTAPTVTKEDLQAKYQLRGSATTNFADSKAERKYNIRKGAGIINGTVLKAGETFSTNDTLGTRTSGNGWKMAGAYENGTVVEQAGGGVCQLSTTLYNAAVKADLEIVSRRNHSMKVGYIDMGLDATINSVGNIIDFQFKNNTGSDIVVFAYTIDNKKITFEIWGVPFNTDAYDEIKLTSERVSKEEPASEPLRLDKPEGEIKPDGSGTLAAGEEWTYVSPRTGYVYQSYKHYYKNGTEVRKEPLARSTYKSVVGEIWVCTTQASPTPEIPYYPDATVTPAVPNGTNPTVPTDNGFTDLPAGAF